MKRKSVICAIVKNEQRFIREWVEHYINIGFDKIYVYEDFGSDSHKDELSDYISDRKVELTPLDTSDIIPHYEKGTTVQSELYSVFLAKCKYEGLADWVGFFDVDEFMFFEDGWDLDKLEDAFENCGGVLLAWRLFGASGHIDRPLGNVVDNYTEHLPDGTFLQPSVQWNVKSLVNVKNCTDKLHIHVFNGCKFTNGDDYNVDGKLVFEKAWLNHYYTKSWEDYLERIFARGNMHNNFRCLDKFFECNPGLMNKKEEMCLAQRNRHCVSTMWISRDLGIISGGNEERLRELNEQNKNG